MPMTKRAALWTGAAIALVAAVLWFLGAEDSSRHGSRTESVPASGATGTAGGPPSSHRDLVVFEGTVRAAGMPVGGARVAVHAYPADAGDSWLRTAPSPDPIAGATTQADGSFEIAAVRHRVVALFVYARGRVRGIVRLLVPRGVRVVRHDVELVAGFPLHVRVLSSAGKPEPGVPLQVRETGWSSPADGLVTAAGRTDVRGEKAWEALEPGPLRLDVDAGNVRHTVYFSVPMHGTLTVRLDDSMARVGGRITSAGQPVTNARVEVATQRGPGAIRQAMARAHTSADGRFSLSVPAGQMQTVRLIRGASVYDAGLGHFDHGLPRLEAGSAHSVEWPWPEGATVQGRLVVRGGGLSASGARVVLMQGRSRLAVSASDDGTFQFSDVPPGEGYRLRATCTQGPPGVGIPIALSLRAGEQRPVSLALHPAGRVEGYVVGFGPPSDFLLDPSAPSVRLESGAFGTFADVDGSGRFVFLAVPAGGAALRYREAQTDIVVVAGQTVVATLTGPARRLVRGVVRDPSGMPVPDAYVSIDYWSRWGPHSPWRGVRTDQEGRFQLDFADPPIWASDAQRSDWMLVVAHPAHVVTVRRELPVPNSGESVEVNVRLQSGRPFDGRVVRPDKEPAAYAQVEIVDDGWLLGTVSADARGRFRFPVVGAPSPGLRASHSSGELPRLSEWHSPPAANPVELHLVAPLLVGGRVVDADGRGVCGVQVSLMVDEWRDGGSAESGVNGSFLIVAYHDREYDIVLIPDTFAGTGVVRTAAGRVRPGRLDHVFRVDRGGQVTGTVRDASGRPLPHALVVGAWREPGDSWATSHTRARPRVYTDRFGRFRLRGLVPDAVDLIVFGRRHAVKVVKGVAAGSRDVAVRIEKGAVLAGQILDAKARPLGGADIVLKPAEKQIKVALEYIEKAGGSGWAYSAADDHLQGKTDEAGRFRFTELLPGRYHVRAHWSWSGRDQHLLPKQAYAADGKPFVTRTRPALCVSGRVLDQNGRAVSYRFDHKYRSGAHVEIKGHSAMRLVTSADSRGLFAICGLEPGEVVVRAEAGDDYEPVEVRVTAGTKGIEIVLHKRE